MKSLPWAKAASVLTGIAVAVSAVASSPRTVSSNDCSFRNDPDAFLAREGQARNAAFERARLLGNRPMKAPSRATAAEAIPRVNFIDQEIFNRLEQLNIQPAPLTTDEEFVRRIYFDLTGRLPVPDQIRSFLADGDPAKRAPPDRPPAVLARIHG